MSCPVQEHYRQAPGIYTRLKVDTSRHQAKLEVALECLAYAGHLTLCATGLSMMPRIRPGSRVRIRRAHAGELTPGDVILARTAEGIRLHRLVSVGAQNSQPVWITRGDNHPHCDPPLVREQILGVMTHVQKPALLQRALRRLRIA